MSYRRLTRTRKLLLWTGLGVVLVAAASNWLGLSASPGLSPGKILLAGIGLTLTLAGLLGRSLVGLYKGTAGFLLNTVVLLVLLEAFLLFTARVRDAFPKEETARAERLRYLDDGREHLPYYREQEWAEDYWREYHQAWDPEQLRFEPYLLWKSPPYSGKTIQIGSNAVRHTPASDCREGSLTVFTLGGSTMWGTGVPDSDTIANFLAIELNERSEQPVCVVNLAEQAYVSTQELLRLVFELRNGARPDMVIFYDGINDVFAAYQSGSAGDPQNLEQLRRRLEEPRPDLGDQILKRLNETRTSRLARRITDSRRAKELSLGADGPQPELDRLSRQIFETTVANYDFVEALGEQFGFASRFFWQPLLLLEQKPLTIEESHIRQVAEEVHPRLRQLYEASYSRIGAPRETDAQILSIDTVLAESPGLCYIDPWHLTGDANKRVALAIAEEVLPLIGQGGDDNVT